jgi:hypothetical protein
MLVLAKTSSNFTDQPIRNIPHFLSPALVLSLSVYAATRLMLEKSARFFEVHF